MADNDDEKKSATCTFFKKPSRNKNIRKREAEEEEEDEGPAVLPKAKLLRKNDNKLKFSSATSSKKFGHEDNDDSETPATFFYESSKEIQVQNDSRATATLDTETEFTKDARAIRERVLKQAEESLKGKAAGDEKLYKGIHGYTDFKAGFRREQTIAGEKAGGAHGPLRASANIRTSVRFDYQPDICKDYKETGYCGYGDSCKFMHDRGDYKSGWQMEREWDEAEKRRKAKLAQRVAEGEDEDAESNDEDEDSLPFACFICREPFQEPVVTRCKHYFCEHCALKHHARNKNCYVCNKPTSGVFNTAHEILRKVAEDKVGATKRK
ncbi:zinc finger CCCH domain-containing protein 1 [Cryptomeria japonica]|uniref:zinc finger CCCH domain-containing protein 1 n=1 Tax=Cryptomeria japonica TaxID=3369 RepID=UPI0025AC812A|nr:zinc finger CCCH domain-containing protein 1 [Cryptomeria japonica]